MQDPPRLIKEMLQKSSYWENFDYIETNYDLVGKTDSTVCQLELYRWRGIEP
ncbi:MAG: hypothetical protein K2H68_01040 [Bacteroidales bacterium]|nr:hypothetical protein [Bacteroidales bacterium]